MKFHPLDGLHEIIETTTEVSEKMLEKLDSIESLLVGIGKTLENIEKNGQA